jgi:hypothetical protein
LFGNQANIKGSSDLYGVEFPNEIHDNFTNYQDTILCGQRRKQVSNTLGHDLMQIILMLKGVLHRHMKFRYADFNI